jgi:hypothetical protein
MNQPLKGTDWSFELRPRPGDVLRAMFLISPQGENGRFSLSKRVLCRLAILALLVALAGFVTVARNSWYCSQSNPAHYLSIASKAKVSCAQAMPNQEPLKPIARSVQPQPNQVAFRRTRENPPETPKVSLNVLLQHRSPPAA